MDINQDSILGAFLPNVYITKIILNDDRVILSLMIKENLEDDEELSYLSSDFLKEFINITLIQSVDEKLTENLADNFLVEKNKFNNRMSKVLLNLKRTKNSKISYDEEGNREIHYEHTFFLNTTNLEHLSYFTFCEINELEIKKKFKLNSSVRLSFSPNKVTNEIVIENENVTEESYVYLLPDGSLWAGAVKERANNQYVTVEPVPRRLERNVINNYKVQDFRSRTIKTLSPSSIQIEQILSQEGESLIESSFNRNILKTLSKNKSFIYDIFHTYNSDSSVTINFKIDFSEMLRQNSPFSALINENSTYPELNDGVIANTEIINCKLFRRQVKTSKNKLNNKPIDLDEPEYIIFSGIPEELNTGEPNKDIKHYFITDLDIKEKAYGEYQYYIVLEIKDGIIEFLRSKLTLLIENNSYLKNYYNSSILIENYDADTDSFTDDFSRQYSIDEVAILVNNYISTLAQVYNLNQFETEKLQKTLSLFVSPTLGNPKGILYFISLYDNLMNKLSQYVSLNNNNSISDSNSYSSPKETILVTKEFNSVVDISLLNTVRVEYLPLRDGSIDLNSFRDRVSSEIAKFNLNNTNIYNNEYSTCYLSPSKIILENKEHDLMIEKTNEEYSLLRSEIQCLNKQKTTNSKILQSTEEDQKVRAFNNIKNVLSDHGITFEYLKISGSTVEIDDLEYKNVSLTDVESQDNFFKIDPKTYDASKDIEEIFNEYYLPKISTYPNTPNQIIKFNGLPVEQKNINTAKNILDYCLLTVIEYNDDGEWKLLTDSELDKNIKEPGTKVISCRLRKYQYNVNNIKQQNLINYIYNEYFTINLDTETTDNFITTAIPNPVLALTEQERNNLLNRNSDLEINEVLPKIRYYDLNTGQLDDKEMVIRGQNFKKGVEVYIFKDKISKNNIIFKGSTKSKNSGVSLSGKSEIKIKFNKIENYQNLVLNKLLFRFRDSLFIPSLSNFAPVELDTIILIKDLKNNIVEYKDFKLSSILPVKKITPITKELIKRPVTHFDNKDKIRSIMDIGLGIKKDILKKIPEKTIFDDINKNIKPILPIDFKKLPPIKDKIKNLPFQVSDDIKESFRMKPTAPEINVKNISSNSKMINLFKEETTNLVDIDTDIPEKIITPTRNVPNQSKDKVTTTKSNITQDIQPAIKPQPKQTVSTNKAVVVTPKAVSSAASAPAKSIATPKVTTRK